MRLRYKISILFIVGMIVFVIYNFVIFNSNSVFLSEMKQDDKLILEQISLEQINISEQDIINDCVNLSLINTSNCLRDNIKPFFIYNITDDKLSLTFFELKVRGGDCRNWAFLYERLGKKLNFNTSTVRVEGVSGVFSPHRFAVIWDNSSYCKLDMLNDVECFKIKKEVK